MPLTAVAYNGRLYVLGVAIGSNKEFVNSFDGNKWSGWSEIGGGGTTPRALTCAVFNGRLLCFWSRRWLRQGVHELLRRRRMERLE
jgi:hypothetical protein